MAERIVKAVSGENIDAILITPSQYHHSRQIIAIRPSKQQCVVLLLRACGCEAYKLNLGGAASADRLAI